MKELQRDLVEVQWEVVQKDLGLLAVVEMEHQKGSLWEVVRRMVLASLLTDLAEKRGHGKGSDSKSD